MEKINKFYKSIEEHIELFNNLYLVDKSYQDLLKELIKTLKNGNKIIVAGNGGSASDAQHFAAELVGRF